jgi:hypothetical protein
MLRMILAVAFAAALVAIGVAGLAVAQAERGVSAQHSEFSAQKKKKAVRRRPPIRIRVQPAYRHYHSSSQYPRPDDVSAPGPNAVRLCRSWLARENRPSGTVIVPRMRCWWERG